MVIRNIILKKFIARSILNNNGVDIDTEEINYSNINKLVCLHNYNATLDPKLVKEIAIEYKNDINQFSEKDEIKKFTRKYNARITVNQTYNQLFVTFFTYSEKLHDKLKTSVETTLSKKIPSDNAKYITSYYGGRKHKRKTRKNIKTRNK